MIKFNKILKKIPIYFIFVISIMFFIVANNCTVNDTTALIRVDNMGSAEIKNLKIGNILIIGYLQKGAVYDYWAITQFEGRITVEGAKSSYTEDVYLKIRPQWEYSIYIVTDEDGDNVWSVSVDKQGDGDEDQSDVREFD